MGGRDKKRKTPVEMNNFNKQFQNNALGFRIIICQLLCNSAVQLGYGFIGVQ